MTKENEFPFSFSIFFMVNIPKRRFHSDKLKYIKFLLPTIIVIPFLLSSSCGHKTHSTKGNLYVHLNSPTMMSFSRSLAKLSLHSNYRRNTFLLLPFCRRLLFNIACLFAWNEPWKAQERKIKINKRFEKEARSERERKFFFLSHHCDPFTIVCVCEREWTEKVLRLSFSHFSPL